MENIGRVLDALNYSLAEEHPTWRILLCNYLNNCMHINTIKLGHLILNMP